MTTIYFNLTEYPNEAIVAKYVERIKWTKGFRIFKKNRKCKIKNGKATFYSKNEKSSYCPAKVEVTLVTGRIYTMTFKNDRKAEEYCERLRSYLEYILE